MGPPECQTGKAGQRSPFTHAQSSIEIIKWLNIIREYATIDSVRHPALNYAQMYLLTSLPMAIWLVAN